VDAVFRALADPTRRSLLDALFSEDGQTLSALEERLPMTRFGVMKHLKVLEEAGLVVARTSSSRAGAGARSSTSSTPSRSGSSTTDG
jgi:DNA-binding transcriptional ArsR family regulator